MLTLDLIVLCLAAFCAGFVDSLVGGGGLIQLPAMMMSLPNVPLVTILGTNKMVSILGTATATYRYSQQIKFVGRIAIPAVISALIFSALGAWTITLVDPDILKPLFLILLFGVFILTLINKTMGMNQELVTSVPLWKTILIGSVMGFYDGFFGPGAGTYLVLAFVGVLGMTFVQGSAYAKLVNLSTNFAAVIFFIIKGHFLLEVAIPMMVFNIFGAILGVRLALLRGNGFIRIILRLVVVGMLIRFGFEILN